MAFLLNELTCPPFPGVLDRVQDLEEMSQKLQESDDILNDLGTLLTKYEGKVSAHAALGAAAHEPKHLDKVKVST